MTGGEQENVLVQGEGVMEQNVQTVQEEPRSCGEIASQGQGGEQMESQAQVHQAEEESSESDLDRFIQGEIAPPLTRKEQLEMARNGIFLVVATNITGELFITQLAEKYYSKEEQREIRRKGGEILISRTEDTHEIYQMARDLDISKFQKETATVAAAASASGAGTSNVAVEGDETIQQEGDQPTASITEMLEDLPASEESSAKESAVGSPRGKVPKRKLLSRSERGTRVSVTRGEEVEPSEGDGDGPPAAKKAKKTATGKNLAALRRQTAEQEGRDPEDLFLPTTPGGKTFKDSVYGQDRGSTRVFGGKGRGKSGKHRQKATPKKLQIKLKGWQDPQVVRALQNKPPPGALCMEEACKKRYGGGAKMIHTTWKKKQPPAGKPKTPSVAAASKAARKIQEARKQIQHHKPGSRMKWMKEIKEHQSTVKLLIPKLPFQRLVREIAQKICTDLHFQGNALLALQEACEQFLVSIFDFSNLLAIHAKRVTVKPKDFILLLRIWKDIGFYSDWHSVGTGS